MDVVLFRGNLEILLMGSWAGMVYPCRECSHRRLRPSYLDVSYV